MEQNEYQLTAEETAVIAEYNKTIADLDQQRQGSLRMLARIHGLDGSWDLVGTKLIRRKEGN